ncbi:MAG TPA: HEAT repeat domain-containing protein [Kofleriaceae bacterium]|jgi:hypothetical protein
MVFGLFSKEKSLQKLVEKATNKLAQQPDRWGALERLKEDGSPAALLGLCKRFSVTSMKGVEDEQEKVWVVETLASMGADARVAVSRYMKAADQLAFPLRVLERTGTHDEVLAVVDELLAIETPGYVRMPERRIDLLHWLSEWKAATDEEIVSRLAPYVTDFDENVRFTAIEGMGGRPPAMIIPPLVAAFLRPEEESNRIRRTILEVIGKTQTPLGESGAKVAALLTGPLADFKVDGGLVKRR